MRPSEFPRDPTFRNPASPPFTEQRGEQAFAHVFSYADARRVQLNRDGTFSHDARAWLPENQHHLRWRFMWAADPGSGGRHDVLRGLIAGWFRHQSVGGMTQRVEQHARDLRCAIVRKGTGEFNLAAEFAYPLALRTTCSLVGFPAHREDWLAREMEIVGRTPDFAQLETRDGFESFLWETVAKRLADPGSELLDHIVAGWKAGTIDDQELLAFFFGLAAAGTDTTGTSIVDAFALPSEFGVLDHLRANLDNDRALGVAIDEILRFGTPFPTTPGIFATRPVAIGDLEVPTGAQVYVHLAAANRDRQVNGGNKDAADPTEFDLTRQPNRHMSFGVGVHHCLGDGLTRREMTIALRELLRYLPGLVFDESKPFHRYAGIVDGVTAAHFRFDQGAAENLL